MWSYTQRSGRLRDASGKVIAVGYSGAGEFKNDPAAQNVPDSGPCPCGVYDVGAPVDTKTHGPYVLWLTPDPANEMWGRSAFGVHGDSIVEPGTASEGCIIVPRFARERLSESGERLEVVAEEPQPPMSQA